jgi:transposase
VRLAEELRANRIVSVFHEESRLWNLRAIVNSYRDFTADLVRSKNRYKALLRYRGRFETSRSIYNKPELLETITIAEERFVAKKLFDQIQRQQAVKDSYEEKFEALSKQWPVIKKLTSIPGISNIRASIATAIICSPHRFANKHKLWAYCKLVRYIDVSDGKIYGSRNTHGRGELKAVFIGAATSVLLGTSSLRKYYDQLRTKGVCHNDAKRAVARRIAAISLMIMKTGNTYDDHHEEKRRRNSMTKS